LFPDPALLASAPGYLLIREVDAGVCLALGIVGVAIALIGRNDWGVR
jgi:hypothetical protein